MESSDRKRLVIVGAGSSGLIMLYWAKQELSDWEIVVYEKSGTILGCWGKPYPGFVSTSTKFTTQFACFPKFDACVVPDGGSSRSEFFCEGEYGEYLESFADEFQLKSSIQFYTSVEKVIWEESKQAWVLQVVRKDVNESVVENAVESFDAVILCTGLAAQPKEVSIEKPCLSLAELNHTEFGVRVRDSRVVVMGGGESAVDHACRLAREDLNNEVFLSIQSGIRVSPRYHPIRGVPSDFLRNRLMLSINEHMRNWIGQRFVELRILYEDRFRKFFPESRMARSAKRLSKESHESDVVESSKRELKKQWAYRLTKSAKDDLFNMFHNKSDDFLDLVSNRRIRIVGMPVDSKGCDFYEFQSSDRIPVNPDWIVPSIGYRSNIESLSNGLVRMEDFYSGCVSLKFPNLFLVGFARPIIGNIPSISEVQATYITRLLSKRVRLPANVGREHMEDRQKLQSRFSRLNLNAIYPVEMFPYCDDLAARMGYKPTIASLGSLSEWIRCQLAPASTLQYFPENRRSKEAAKGIPIYMPGLLIVLLLMLKPIDWVLRGWWYASKILSSRRGGNLVNPDSSFSSDPSSRRDKDC
jgi:dimethylaniline monooxygenase (N-oxide forming)